MWSHPEIFGIAAALFFLYSPPDLAELSGVNIAATINEERQKFFF